MAARPDELRRDLTPLEVCCVGVAAQNTLALPAKTTSNVWQCCSPPLRLWLQRFLVWSYAHQDMVYHKLDRTFDPEQDMAPNLWTIAAAAQLTGLSITCLLQTIPLPPLPSPPRGLTPHARSPLLLSPSRAGSYAGAAGDWCSVLHDQAPASAHGAGAPAGASQCAG